MLIKVIKFTTKFKVFDFHYPNIPFCNFQNSVSEFELFVFYVTCNDISVIYVTAQMCRRIEEEFVPAVGLPTP